MQAGLMNKCQSRFDLYRSLGSVSLCKQFDNKCTTPIIIVTNMAQWYFRQRLA